VSDIDAGRADQNLAVYQELRQAIVSGRLMPSERLVEADLVRLTGAGRSAIRTALVRLEQEGLVTREPHRGARVRLVSDEEAIEITEARAALEVLVVRCAAERATRDDVAELRRIVAQMRERVADGDLLAFSELNGRFHERVRVASRHQTAARLLSMLRSQSIRFQYQTILQAGRAPRSLVEHEAIAEAVARRDADAAEATMRAHLAHVVETLRAAIAQHQLR
jgi:DNA-binding GntR family transcriptional regulator